MKKNIKKLDCKFEPWRSEADHATSRSRRLPTKLYLYEWAGKKHFVSLNEELESSDLEGGGDNYNKIKVLTLVLKS